MHSSIQPMPPRERPILFSAPMIRALLDGTKTQTRRVLKQPKRKDGAKLLPELLQQMGIGAACPYGAVGDRLWVRETWALAGSDADVTSEEMKIVGNEALIYGPSLRLRADGDGYDRHTQAWRPSIFMPRWASRITLEITEVRVQRLQDITEADAKAEGVFCPAPPQHPEACGCWAQSDDIENRWHFQWLWDSINGERGFSFESNPWVWCVSFRRVEAK